jgi:hypothetical protein
MIAALIRIGLLESIYLMAGSLALTCLLGVGLAILAVFWDIE